ncbi:hypothetical protein Tco_0926462 [Tanacetum coccineum]|uniref:Uncharacterized protein n=1 Tax=Tanacetum coccineum TaxID=301880 RepID=A0ABQ5DCM6_9ASTR
MYPRLFLLELDKQVTVASILRDTSLVPSFRRVSRGGIEKEQLRLLDNSLSHIILPQIGDRWTWNLESSGNALNLLKKGVLVLDEPKDNSGSSSSSLYGSNNEDQDVSGDEEKKADENIADAEVVEKQA